MADHAAGPTADSGLEEIVGVYDADGSLAGEISYVVGKILRVRHCSLCDITHSPVRRKKEWDDFVRTVGVPVTVLHRDEIGPDRAALWSLGEFPLVAARIGQDYRLLLSSAELSEMDGSVTTFSQAVRSALFA